jgi:hypothetical protein
MYRRLNVLLEGDDDRRFFDAVIRPVLQEQYDYVEMYEYAQKAIPSRIEYLRSTRAANADYFFMGDFNTAPCITEKKKRLIETYEPVLDVSHIVIVVREIESWYLAGLDDASCQEFGIPTHHHRHTEGLTKEQFESLVPARFDSIIDFMNEILNRFSTDTARVRNRSFAYLMNRLEAIGKKA